MTHTDAYRIVRQKLREEKDEVKDGPAAAKYKTAMKQYPALMTVAHMAFAIDSRKST